jgi:hypothetical protein
MLQQNPSAMSREASDEKLGGPREYWEETKDMQGKLRYFHGSHFLRACGMTSKVNGHGSKLQIFVYLVMNLQFTN